MKKLQSLVIWSLLVIVITCIYGWNQLHPAVWDSVEYQNQIRNHATGDRVGDLIQHLDSRPLSESFEY